MKGYKTIPTHPDYAISRGGRVIRRKDGKVRDAAMTALTAGLMIFYLLGGYN